MKEKSYSLKHYSPTLDLKMGKLMLNSNSNWTRANNSNIEENRRIEGVFFLGAMHKGLNILVTYSAEIGKNSFITIVKMMMKRTL